VSSKENVVVLGDFNEFEFNLPLVNLLDTPLTNLAFTVPAEERYSFIFNGNSQALDHIFVSPALKRSAELEYIHVNAEFADNPERASDHDPLVASIVIAGVGGGVGGNVGVGVGVATKRTNVGDEGERRLRRKY
jgi:predicted extracellular nuclease